MPYGLSSVRLCDAKNGAARCLLFQTIPETPEQILENKIQTMGQKLIDYLSNFYLIQKGDWTEKGKGVITDKFIPLVKGFMNRNKPMPGRLWDFKECLDSFQPSLRILDLMKVDINELYEEHISFKTYPSAAAGFFVGF